MLIKILLFLRNKGIKDEKVLLSIEKIPPHYFLFLLQKSNTLLQINYEETARLAKILQEAFISKKKISNILITEFNLGWFLIISSFMVKRVYGLCNNKENILNVERICNILKIPNIFIKKSNNCLDWKKVAPFDMIISLNSFESFPNQFLKLLDDDGLIFFAKENKDKLSIVKANKNKKIEQLRINNFTLSENIIL